MPAWPGDKRDAQRPQDKPRPGDKRDAERPQDRPWPGRKPSQPPVEEER